MFEDLKNLLGESVSFEQADLISHSRDYWPRSFLVKRLGQNVKLPKAVISPHSIEDIQKLVKWANQEKVAIIPYGGGSGVCGGVDVIEESVALNLGKLNQVLEINEKAQYVSAQAGILGKELELKLNQKGFSLCHFPASFEISTLGGWIATRASGQFSTAFGSIEHMLLALEVVLSDSTIARTKLIPRTSTGPSLKELFLGSEGTLGIITEATCQIQRLPETMDFLSFSFNSIEAGLNAIRTLLQKGIFPSVVRLYDEADTMMALSEIGISATGNLLILVFQGGHEMVSLQKKISQTICSLDGKNLAEEPAKHWWKHRFDLNEVKMTQILSQKEMILDTIEVAATWDHLEDLYCSMKKAIESEISVLAHFSHFYVTGGSIYFTFIGSTDEKEVLSKYDYIWEKAMRACLNAHGTISHHHGIGMLRREWLKEELGSGLDVLQKIKNALDPNHILNPKKLL